MADIPFDDRFSRHDGENKSTLFCSCGDSFSWEGVSDELRPWVERHNACAAHSWSAFVRRTGTRAPCPSVELSQLRETELSRLREIARAADALEERLDIFASSAMPREVRHEYEELPELHALRKALGRPSCPDR